LAMVKGGLQIWAEGLEGGRLWLRGGLGVSRGEYVKSSGGVCINVT